MGKELVEARYLRMAAPVCERASTVMEAAPARSHISARLLYKVIGRIIPGHPRSDVLALKHNDPWIREGACSVLGSFDDRNATWPLVQALSDPHLMVRRQAAFALVSLRDPESANAIKARYAVSGNDDINVRFALECALRELGVTFEEWPKSCI